MKDERFFWGDLHPVCVLRGLLYNLWVLILAVLTAWLCVEDIIFLRITLCIPLRQPWR